MATVVQPILEPDREAIKAHLSALFEPALDEYPEGLIEVCHGPSKPDRAAYFGLDESGIDAAADFAVAQNRQGQNVYVGANPRKPGTGPGRAADSDVEIAFYQFADLDRQDAVTSYQSKLRAGDLIVKPTMYVMTGTIPNKRPHFYWRLEEPVANLPAWSERQRGIAQNLAGDPVINPSRIMRLGGTVNYPSQDKLQRGYKVELTGVVTDFNEERPPVSPDAVATAYPVRQQVFDAGVQLPAPQHGQTTLAAMSGRVRIADLIRACQSGNEWHNNMVRLVAHLASTGRTDAEILGLAAGITLPGYTVEQSLKEMHAALIGARNKWNLPEPDDSVEAEEKRREDGEGTFQLLDLDELENLPPPTWLIHELIADHGLSIIYGDPGAGKSFIALDMALRIAFGMDWHGTEAKRAGVLYVAGEGSRGLANRVKGWRREHALEGADAPFLLLPVAVQLLDPAQVEKLIRTIEEAALRVSFEIGLVIIDTVSRAIAGQDENGQEAMSLFVEACGAIQTHTGGAVIGIHHSGKDSARGMRGSTVLLGGCDASLKLSKDEAGRVTIECEKQKDAEQAAPVFMTMKKVEWQSGIAKSESTLVPIKSEKPLIEEKAISRRHADEIFDEVDRAWSDGNPWSVHPQAQRRGRWIVKHIAETYEVTQRVAEDHVSAWQMRGYMATEIINPSTKASGLRVLRRLEPDQ